MSRKGHFAGGYARHALRLASVAMATTALAAHGAVADLIPDDAPVDAPPLKSASERKADALAWFVTGLFEEESEGPEKAMASKRKALALDPANSPLAIEIAYDLLRRSETAEAISVLKDTAKAASDDPTAHLALASIYLRQLHKPDLATKHAQAALEAAPGSFSPYESLWEIAISQGQISRARQILERAARVKSDDPEFWLAAAGAFSRSAPRENGVPAPSAELTRRVTKLLDKAAELAGDDPAVLAKVADQFALAGQPDKALPLYEKVVETKASLPRAREKLAGCYLELGRNAEAAAVLEEIVKLNSLNIVAYDLLTKIYLGEENFDKALAAAKQALLIDPRNIERHWHVAKILFFDLQRFDEAADVLAEARKRFPRKGELTILCARAMSLAKRHEEAIPLFEEALVEASNSQPDLLNAEFYFFYGAAAEQAKLYVKAADLFRKAIALDPANAAQACNYLGYMWVERGENLDEAEQLIRRAIDAEPQNGAYIDSLGWLFFQQGKYQDAVTELLRAAEALNAEPDAVVFDHIGDAYDKLGKKAEAVLYWQKSLKIDPTNKTVAAKLDKAAEKVAKKPADQAVLPP